MKSKKTLNNIRNIGIIAHIDAGKTTLSERILFYAQKIHKMGEVHDGAATMDFMPEEQERGITIASACTTYHWQSKIINLIDTPGHVDFTIEVERSLRVLDGAVGVFCAVGGVEPQSETVWQQSEKFFIPKLVFINKIDRLGANFFAVLTEIKERLGANPIALTIPLGESETFSGIIDLICLQKVIFNQEQQGRDYQKVDLSREEMKWALLWREKLIESLADFDEEILQAYLNGKIEEIDPVLIKHCIRKATILNNLVPVFAGSALKNIGVQPLMDAVVEYLPDPEQARPIYNQLILQEQNNSVFSDKNSGKNNEKSELELKKQAELLPDVCGNLAALVFKIIVEANRSYVLLRIYGGKIAVGDLCYNYTKNISERVSKIYRLHANHKEALDLAFAGDIVALGGLKSARTGDTLCLKEFPVVLENISLYKPVITIAIEPKNIEEGKKLDEALTRFLMEDPTLHLEIDEATSQRIVSGMGELHLEVLLDRIKREYNITPRAGIPQVVYQETINIEAIVLGVFEREFGDAVHHGSVSLKLSPRLRGEGNKLEFKLSDENLPKAWREAVKQGILDGLQSGIVLGYPIADILVTVLALNKKDNISSAVGFQMAAGVALKEALRLAKVVLLEPIMTIDITVPDDFVGEAINLIVGKGGRIEEMKEQLNQKHIKAIAGLRSLFGFSTALRSATQGRASMVMQFNRFDALE